MLNKYIDLENKYNVEYHIPGYNYCGPGTKVITRFINNINGINPLDCACKLHDVEYFMYAGNDKLLADSDQKLINAATKEGGYASFLVSNIFELKKYLEKLGIITPSGFATILAKDTPLHIQNAIGNYLYDNYLKNK
jgi:hypothetical protein